MGIKTLATAGLAVAMAFGVAVAPAATAATPAAGNQVNDAPTAASPVTFAQFAQEGHNNRLSTSPLARLAVDIDTGWINPVKVIAVLQSSENADANIYRELRRTGSSGTDATFGASIRLSPSAPEGPWEMTVVRVFDGNQWQDFQPPARWTTVSYTDRVASQPGANLRSITLTPYTTAEDHLSMISVRTQVSDPVTTWWGDEVAQVTVGLRGPDGDMRYVEVNGGNHWQALLPVTPGRWSVATIMFQYADQTIMHTTPIAELGMVPTAQG